jgi:hypothetical protein
MPLLRRDVSSQSDDITYDCDHTSSNTAVVDAQHISSRNGMPWSVEEDRLLMKLRDVQNLAWAEVVRQSSRKISGWSKGSILVYSCYLYAPI